MKHKTRTLEPAAIENHIARHGTTKSFVCREAGVSRAQLYAFLFPSRYPSVKVTADTIDRLTVFLERYGRAA